MQNDFVIAAADGPAPEHQAFAAARALRLACGLRRQALEKPTDRLTRLAKAVSQRLGLSEDAASLVGLAASVKDIGTLAVSDALLGRRGPLSTTEWEEMSGHVLAAERLLSKVPELRALAPIVRSAHERWDGEGYPDGRSRDDIPLASRIVAACDAFVAMTSDRPFRQALDEPTALHQVREIAGAQLDPAVVEALVAEVAGRESKERRPRLQSRQSPPAPSDDSVLTRLDSIEPIPALATARDRVFETLDQRHPNRNRVIRQLESDPGLALCSLRAASGVAGVTTASTVPEAVSALGWLELRRVVAEAPALDFLWPRTPWEAALQEFRLHAVAVQRAAVRLADAVGFNDVDGLAVAALLHDIGRLALTRLRSDYRTGQRALGSTEERLRAERLTFGVDHATVGGIVARSHGLPERLSRIIGEHHSDEAGKEGRLLCVADALAHQSQGRSALPEAVAGVARGLELSPDLLWSITYELPHADGSRRDRTEPARLSRRQLDALRGLAAGKTYEQIARDMGLKVSTVRSHLHTAYGRLDVTDRAQAVLIATERGWL